MRHNARDAYLETEVLTASPQRLRLMLIDGALRQARQASQLAEQQRLDDAAHALARCGDIVIELLGSIQPHVAPVARDVASVYIYLFQSLTEIHVTREFHKLAGAINVLEIERETWQQVCTQMPAAPPGMRSPTKQASEISAASAADILAAGNPAARSPTAGQTLGPFSIDA